MPIRTLLIALCLILGTVATAPTAFAKPVNDPPTRLTYDDIAVAVGDIDGIATACRFESITKLLQADWGQEMVAYCAQRQALVMKGTPGDLNRFIESYRPTSDPDETIAGLANLADTMREVQHHKDNIQSIDLQEAEVTWHRSLAVLTQFGTLKKQMKDSVIQNIR